MHGKFIEYSSIKKVKILFEKLMRKRLTKKFDIFIFIRSKNIR